MSNISPFLIFELAVDFVGLNIKFFPPLSVKWNSKDNIKSLFFFLMQVQTTDITKPKERTPVTLKKSRGDKTEWKWGGW